MGSHNKDSAVFQEVTLQDSHVFHEVFPCVPVFLCLRNAFRINPHYCCTGCGRMPTHARQFEIGVRVGGGLELGKKTIL